MIRRRSFGWLALLLLAGCGDLGETPVMRLGNQVFHLSDLRHEFADLPSIERPSLETREARRAFAESVASRRLLAELGEEVVAEDPDWRQRMAAQRRRLLVRRLQILVGGEPEVTADQIQEATQRMSTQWRVQRFRFPEAASAARVLEEFGPGEELAALAGRFRGALILDGFVQWSPFPDRFLDQVAEADVGGLVGPIESALGTDLALVIEEQKLEPSNPDEMRARAIRGLRVRAQTEHLDELIQRLRAEAQVRWNEEALAWLVARTRTAILGSGTESGEAGWAVPEFDPGDEDLVIAEWAGGARWTAGDYQDAMKEMPLGQRPRVRLASAVRASCDAGVTTRLLHEEAVRRGLDREWWAERAVRRVRAEIWQAAAVGHLSQGSSPALAEVDSLTSLLLSAQPQLFRREDQARVIWFEMPSRAGAEREFIQLREKGVVPRLQEILDGSPVPLAGFYQVSTLTRGAVEVPGIERDVFEGGAGTVTGPHELRGQWVIVACLEVTPGRQLSREEALEDIWERTRQAGDSRASELWVAARKKEVGFSIDEDALDALAPGA